jgi:hypothetical protein
MGEGYQAIDQAVVDYHLYELEGLEAYPMRGPRQVSDRSERYVAYIGAAQTFGRFVARPFPELVAERIGVPALNLGRSGAGPTWYRDTPAAMEWLNSADAVVVQVMSGRSVPNSMMDVPYVGGAVTFREGGPPNPTFSTGKGTTVEGMRAARAYEWVIEHHDEETVRRIVAESRANWIDLMTGLLDDVSTRTVLLWFSHRPPQYREAYTSVARLFGGFPQLVNREMVDAVREHADRYVEVVTDRGRPQTLLNRTTGEVEVVFDRERFPGRPDHTRHLNTYYPSPEMHEDVVAPLAEALIDMGVGG